MRRLFLISLLMLLASGASAFEPRFNFGLEWGMDLQIFSSYKVNYICNEGYRVNENKEGASPFVNGEILAHVGLQTGERWNFSLYSGYAGLDSGIHVVPVFLRADFHPKGVTNNGFLCFAGAGANLMHPAFTARLGAGYRVMMDKRVSFDILFGARGSVGTPTVIDRDTKKPVPQDMVNRAEDAHVGAFLTISLNF